jgi:hypothetical protein
MLRNAQRLINNWMSALKAAKLQYAFRCVNMRLSSGFDDLGAAEVAAGRDAELDSTSTFNQRTFGVGNDHRNSDNRHADHCRHPVL